MIINKNIINQIALLIGIIITRIYGACVKLTGSKSCPGFSNYSIDTVNGIFPLSIDTQPKYTDVASFDTYVVKYAEFLGKNFVALLNVDGTCSQQVISEMETFAVSNLRYLTTFACNYIVNSKENLCQPNETKPKVCKTTCEDFVTSYQGLVNKYNTCLNQNTVSKQITTQNTRCTKATSNFSGTGQCIDSSNEANCGFTSAASASAFCSSSVDACCSNLGGGASGVVSNNANAASPSVAQAGKTVQSSAATSSAKTANVNSASNTSKEQNEANGGGSNKIWIIVGTCCAFLLVGALIYFYRKGESLDNNNNNNNNSFYEQENKFPPFQPAMAERGMNSSGGFSGGMSSPGLGNAMGSGNSFGGVKNNYGNDNGDVLINRTEMNNVGMKNDDDDDFNFGSDSKNYNFTSNVPPSNPNPVSNDNGFSNAALFAGAGAAVGVAAGAAIGAAAMNNDKKEVEPPKPQMVNMTNIQPPESQNSNANATPIIKIDEEPKPQMVNMTNIQPPESQNRNDTSQPPEIKIEDEEPKALMVNMTEIPEPEVQQNRNTKFLSTYSEAPDNQRISSQYYGESDASFDFSSSKLNITSQLDNNHLSVASSAMLSNRVSTTSTDKELNSTPYRAVHTYEPQLNDELLLEMGDIVEVVYVYDDGWVWGINTRTNESGACPMLCLEKVEGSDTESSVSDKMKSIISARESMISRDSVPGRRDSRILKVDSMNMSNMSMSMTK